MLPYKSYKINHYGKHYKIFIVGNLAIAKDIKNSNKVHYEDYWKTLKDNNVLYRSWWNWDIIDRYEEIINYETLEIKQLSEKEFRQLYKNKKFHNKFLEEIK